MGRFTLVSDFLHCFSSAHPGGDGCLQKGSGGFPYIFWFAPSQARSHQIPLEEGNRLSSSPLKEESEGLCPLLHKNIEWLRLEGN